MKVNANVREKEPKDNIELLTEWRNKIVPRYELVENYDAILSTVSEKFTKDILQSKGKLKVISNYGAGIDNIDKNFAETKGISVYNTPDVVTNSTADLTVSIFLALKW